MGRGLIGMGVIFLAVGLLIHFAPGAFAWFGRLPGDIRIEGERGRVFIPIVSMLVLSLALTVFLNLLTMLRR